MSFQCTKTSLIILNIFYIVVGISLIAVSANSLTNNGVSYLPIIGGIVFCGVFLLVISLLGIYAALRHHQVLLFFYMVVLFVLFILQFSIATASLAVSTDTQILLAEQGWKSVRDDIKTSVQDTFGCCGLTDVKIPQNETDGHPSCLHAGICYSNANNSSVCKLDDDCCSFKNADCGCDPCLDTLRESIGQAFRATGGVSLFFSFTEFAGVMLTFRFRNLKDERMHSSSAFL